MFELLDNTKRGRRKGPREVTSLVDAALAKAHSLLHTDLEEGLKYFRIAEQHYDHLDPNHPDYRWIEFYLETLFVEYYNKQAGITA